MSLNNPDQTIDLARPWILKGYELFSKGGPGALKVEAIAKEVGISKSSFYHYFGDKELYLDQLLSYHQYRAQMILEMEAKCSNIDPELVEVLLDAKQDLLFNRQLRIHRSNPEFRTCFEQIDQKSEMVLAELWGKELGISNIGSFSSALFKLALDNFYLRITDDTFTKEWIFDFFNDLKQMISDFENQ